MGKYQVVEPGDIVFNKLRTWQGGLGVSEYKGIVSPAYFVCRPKRDFSARFLHYLLLSAPYLQELTRVSKWQPPSQFDITWEQLRQVPIVAPRLRVQQAIAAYLDAETTRIDALIEKKQRMIALMDERTAAYLCSVFDEASGVRRSLRAIASVTLGRQRSPENDEGPHMVRYLRAANVKDGILDLEDVKSMNFTPMEQERFALRRGDVLVTEGAGSLAAVGASCVWQEELEGTVCIQNTLLRLRPQPGIDGEYLAWWCRYAYRSRLLAAIAGGANIFHLTAEKIRTVPCVVPSTEEQSRMVGELRRSFAKSDHVRSRLVEQIEVLVERRQALITAAVTGQLEIPGVAA